MPKKRVSLTLEEELVERVDREASRRGRNRSQTFEDIVEEHFETRAVDTAVVLCGDPDMKSLRLFKGKPVLEHILGRLSRQAVSDVFLLIGNNSEIRERLGEEFQDLNLEYIEEEEPRGTAAALKLLEGWLDRTFLVVNGHVISDVDVSEMAEAHHREDSLATMALTTVEDPSKYGVARMKGSRILGFEQKPSEEEAPSRLINAGTYIFDSEIFDQLDTDGLDSVFEQLSEVGRLSGYIYGGKWVDIDDY